MSQLRTDVRHIFDCFCEVSVTSSTDGKPYIVKKFPESYQEQGILDVVPDFTYPCDFRSSAVEHFSFVVLQDLHWLYGFCRHSASGDSAIVLLSALPWHNTFYKLLDTLRQVAVTGGDALLTACLDTLYRTAVPSSGGRLQAQLPDGTTFFSVVPDPHSLPALLEDRNLTEYWSVMGNTAIIEVFAAILHERHVVMTSSRVSRLSSCVQAAQALLYPLWWQRIFLPVVPTVLSGCLAAPVSFLAGAPAAVVSRLTPAELADGCVVVATDTGSVRSPHHDLQALPADMVSTLRRNLKHSAGGDDVSRAFHNFVCQLVGGYRAGIRQSPEDGSPVFDEEAFLASQPSCRRPFLRSLLRTQMFERFVGERLERLRETNDGYQLVAACCQRRPEKGGLPRLRRWAILCGRRLAREHTTCAYLTVETPALTRSVPSSPATPRPSCLGTSAPSLLQLPDPAPNGDGPTSAAGRTSSDSPHDGVADLPAASTDPLCDFSAGLSPANGSSLIDEINAELRRRDEPALKPVRPPGRQSPPRLPRTPPVPPTRRRRRAAEGSHLQTGSATSAAGRSSDEALLDEYGLHFNGPATNGVLGQSVPCDVTDQTTRLPDSECGPTDSVSLAANSKSEVLAQSCRSGP